jgi:3-phenylpropionate/trans-cinnamate dioxygenase ferredoxin subunit
MADKKYKWHKLGEPGDELVKEGLVIEWSVPGKHFCITKFEEKYYAFQSKCPHAGAHFEGAQVSEKCEIICPLHKWRFHLRTGYNSTGEGFSLVRYPIDINEHGIWVGIPQQIW